MTSASPFLLTWALWGVIRISIARKLDTGKTPGEEEEEAEAGGLGGTRVETVLPLIRIFIKITLIVMAVLISLSSLGVNIGPLIAGAGVVGIAIGFGAQTLVKDIVSGFFYLIDDAFRIGEYVVIGEIRGTVEKISIRSFQLRHHNGPVHTIPYGDITSLTNWSRDWSIMKFELRIAFETDIDLVRRLIKQIGIDMFEDPQFGPLMLAPMKSQGVNRMDDSALIIRCKFTSVPGQQFLIRREAFTRIQRIFEEKGIQFAPRRVLVEAATPEEAIKGAAAVIDQEVEGKAPAKGQYVNRGTVYNGAYINGFSQQIQNINLSQNMDASRARLRSDDWGKFLRSKPQAAKPPRHSQKPPPIIRPLPTRTNIMGS